MRQYSVPGAAAPEQAAQLQGSRQAVEGLGAAALSRALSGICQIELRPDDKKADMTQFVNAVGLHSCNEYCLKKSYPAWYRSKRKRDGEGADPEEQETYWEREKRRIRVCRFLGRMVWWYCKFS